MSILKNTCGVIFGILTAKGDKKVNRFVYKLLAAVVFGAVFRGLALLTEPDTAENRRSRNQVATAAALLGGTVGFVVCSPRRKRPTVNVTVNVSRQAPPPKKRVIIRKPVRR